jgi:predicted alpha/beta superfamily hydrolase
LKKLIVLLYFSLFIIYPQTLQHKIIFIMHAAGVNQNDTIFISGSDTSLGSWNPGLVNLTKIDDSTWIREFWFNSGTHLEFKFTKGAWEVEALNDDGSVPGNHNHKVLADTSLHFNVTRWRNKEPLNNSGHITGTVKYHLQFQGIGLKPRDIVVWLPPSYEDEREKRYPVLYMHDGQNIFDPLTSTFGFDWRADEVADSLIKAGAIEELIIVAINNTADRGYEYSHSLLGYRYMSFIVNELKTFIDNEYRTLPDEANTATCGASLGGLISLMLVWNYPEIISKAACLSSAFKIGNINYVDSIEAYSGAKKNLKLYIDNGTLGIEEELQSGNDLMLTALKSKGFCLDYDLAWYKDTDAPHSETAWAKRFWRPLLFLFGK